MGTSDTNILNASAARMDRRALMKLTGASVATLAAASLFKTSNAEAQNMANEWDKTFPKSEKLDHQKVAFKNRYGITLVGDLYLPRTGPFGGSRRSLSPARLAR